MTNGAPTPTRQRSKERNHFLAGVLDGALSHDGHGFPGQVEYRWEGREDDGTVYAVIYDRYEDTHLDCVHCGRTVDDLTWNNDGTMTWTIDGVSACGDGVHEPQHVYVVTLDTIARGLGIIRNAVLADFREGDEAVRVLANATTGERLGVHPDIRRAIMLMDRTNGDEGDTDVFGYLAILECAIFGQVVYS